MNVTTESTTTTAAKVQGKTQIIVFKQGDEEYALHIDQIKEVVITPSITRMPQTPTYIKGVANIRGNIIAILDLEEKFNLKRSQDQGTGNNYTLVVESDDLKMGLLVNDVPNTISVSAGDLDESRCYPCSSPHPRPCDRPAPLPLHHCRLVIEIQNPG